MPLIPLVGVLLAGMLLSPAAWTLEGGPPPPAGMADLRSGAGFIPLLPERQVFYEPDGEPLALETAGHLADAVAQVTRVHGRPFVTPPEVFVCATERSFVRLSPTARGITYGGKVFLSPRLMDTPSRIPGILTHELSHVHFIQHLGAKRAGENLPTWFREGLAVTVARGGGAERISEASAAKALLAGKAFAPDTMATRSVREHADEYGLEPHMFYRQSAMFVSYMQRREPGRFNLLLGDLFNGQSFEKALQKSYGISSHELWNGFVEAVSARFFDHARSAVEVSERRQQ